MSTPPPATTEWVPLWDLTGGVALEYRGAWAAGSYRDGDVVVDGGVAYMCVRQTTQRPTPWPIASGSLPPVVDGKWLKGVGGAAVWESIKVADVANAVPFQTGGWPAGTKMQAGRTDGVNVPAGTPASVTITLPVAWTSAHYVFLGMGWPGVHWNFRVMAALPADLGHGTIAFDNATAQGATVTWISIGI